MDGHSSDRRAVYHPGRRRLSFPGHQRCTLRRLPHQSLFFQGRCQPACGSGRGDRFFRGDEHLTGRVLRCHGRIRLSDGASGSVAAGISRPDSSCPGECGRAFVTWYYGWSPRAAAWLRGHAIARKLTRAVLWIPVAFAWLSLRTDVGLALLGFLVLLLPLGWSLRRGPAWWRALCLLTLVIGLASAHTSGWAPGHHQPVAPSGVSEMVNEVCFGIDAKK